MHFFIDLKAVRMPRIQKFCWTIFLTYSVPSWWLLLFSFRKNISTTLCSHCNNTGCLVSKLNWLLPILTWLRINPCWSMNGDNCRVCCFFLKFPFNLERFQLTVSLCIPVHSDRKTKRKQRYYFKTRLCKNILT